MAITPKLPIVGDHEAAYNAREAIYPAQTPVGSKRLAAGIARGTARLSGRTYRFRVLM